MRSASPRWLGLVAVVVCLATGCVGAQNPGGPDSAPVVSSTPTVTPGPTSVPDASPGSSEPSGIGVCASVNPPFGSEGELPVVALDDAPPSDAVTITNLSWQPRGDCDRLQIAFVTAEGAPAVTPPSITAQFLRQAGVVRIRFGPEVTQTAWSTQLVQTPLVDAAYVARRLDGGLMLDVHLAGPAFARVATTSGPAGMTLDLVAGGDDYPQPPIVGADTVIVSPTGGTTPYPLTIDGYLRDRSDDIVTASVEGSDAIAVRSSAAVAPDPVAWAAFAIVFPTGPAGTVVVTIGDRGAQTSVIME